MVDIYMIDVRQFSLSGLYEIYLSAVSRARREKIEQYRMEMDRYRSLGVGILLEWGFYQQVTGKICRGAQDFLCPEVLTGSHGKPCFKEYPNIYFNLSHAGNYAAAAFGSAELGMDIEKPRRFGRKIVKRFFTSEEQAWMTQFQIGTSVESKETAKEREAFTRIWTRKESFVKMNGAGLSYGLQRVETCGNGSLLSCITWQYDGCQHICYFHEYIYQGHVITVCTPESLCGQPKEIVLPYDCRQNF